MVKEEYPDDSQMLQFGKLSDLMRIRRESMSIDEKYSLAADLIRALGLDPKLLQRKIDNA